MCLATKNVKANVEPNNGEGCFFGGCLEGGSHVLHAFAVRRLIDHADRRGELGTGRQTDEGYGIAREAE